MQTKKSALSGFSTRNKRACARAVAFGGGDDVARDAALGDGVGLRVADRGADVGIGAAGAVEAIFCVLAIRDQVAPPTINLDNPAVTPRLDLAPNAAVRRRIDVALSNSFGFGGTNASLILGKVAG